MIVPEQRHSAKADSAATEKGSVAAPLLDRVSRPIVRAVFSWLDSAYVLIQVVLKSYGLASLSKPEPPELYADGKRFLVLPEQSGRWPRLCIPLPEAALFQFSAEGFFQRRAIWTVGASITEVCAHFEDVLADEAVTKTRRIGSCRFELWQNSIRAEVKAAVGPDGVVRMAVGQTMKAVKGREKTADDLRLESDGDPHALPRDENRT